MKCRRTPLLYSGTLTHSGSLFTFCFYLVLTLTVSHVWLPSSSLCALWSPRPGTLFTGSSTDSILKVSKHTDIIFEGRRVCKHLLRTMCVFPNKMCLPNVLLVYFRCLHTQFRSLLVSFTSLLFGSLRLVFYLIILLPFLVLVSGDPLSRPLTVFKSPSVIWRVTCYLFQIRLEYPWNSPLLSSPVNLIIGKEINGKIH